MNDQSGQKKLLDTEGSLLDEQHRLSEEVSITNFGSEPSADKATSCPNLRQWVLLSTSAALMLSGLTVGLTHLSGNDPDGQSNPTVSILPVKTIQVELVKSYQVSRYYTGEVAPRRTSELGFERSGKLVWFAVDEGERVTAGTPQAKLDTSNLETKRLELLAQKAQAIAQLEELQAGPRIERIDAARASVRDLEAQLELARAKRSRREYLYTEGAISQEQLDEVAFDVRTLSARLEEAQSNLEELLAGTRREQIEAQKALVRQLEANIADIAINLTKSTIKAPFSGKISARQVDEGTVVSAGQSVMRLVEDGKPEVRIGIPVLAVSGLTLGSQQIVRIGQKNYQAKVSSILPEVDQATRTQTVILTLEPSAALKVAPGQIARWEQTQTISTAGYWLPKTALIAGARGLWSCYTLAEVEQPPEDLNSLTPSGTKLYRVERRDLEVLHTANDRVLVRGTIQVGDAVVATGTQRLVPNQLVRLGEF